jgi:hypothetical protein
VKVYITYEPDGYDGDKVERVFKSKQSAINYLIRDRFGSEWYKKLPKQELDAAVMGFITTHTVE